MKVGNEKPLYRNSIIPCNPPCSSGLRSCQLLQSPTPGEASLKGVMSADTDASLWGRQPGTMSGNGLDETYRKFAAARRKYMLLYFKLLQSTEGFDVLLAGHAFLQSTVWGSPAMMADLARWEEYNPAHLLAWRLYQPYLHTLSLPRWSSFPHKAEILKIAVVDYDIG